MPSATLMDPELQPVLDFLPKVELNIDHLPILRANARASSAMLPIDTSLPVIAASHAAPGPGGTSSVRIISYFPSSIIGPLPAVLHMHGGGFVVGGPEMADQANRKLVAEVGCAVFSVDYRLAPETQFPGAVEDCYTALAWIHANSAQLQINPNCISVKGESAGGGLAAALALLARDRGEYPLAFQQLIYPMLDDRTCVLQAPHPYTGEFIWTHEKNHFGWSCLLGTAPGGENISPYAAAARAEDLAGLPPTFISVGALDLFLEESLEYARRLTRAGVPVELHVYPGAIHVFDLAANARLTAQSNRDKTEALRTALRKY